MIMKKTDIRVTLAAVQTYLAENLALTILRRKTAVIILNVSGRNNYVACHLNKIMVITAMWADDPTERLAF